MGRILGLSKVQLSDKTIIFTFFHAQTRPHDSLPHYIPGASTSD